MLYNSMKESQQTVLRYIRVASKALWLTVGHYSRIPAIEYTKNLKF